MARANAAQAAAELGSRKEQDWRRQPEKEELAGTRSGTRLLAALGYAGRGVAYVLVAGMAGWATIGTNRPTPPGTLNAMQTLYQGQFGQFLMIFIIMGLLAYSLWSFTRGLLDADGVGHGGSGLAVRFGQILFGVCAASLAAATGVILRSTGNGDSGETPHDWTAQLLAQPYGEPIVVIGGVVIIGVALLDLYRAYRATFRTYLRLAELSSTAKTWVVNLARLAIASRGVVFFMVGIFVIVAAAGNGSRAQKGLGGAFQALATQTYGHDLLAIVTIGLFIFGLYSFALARYRA